MFKSIVEFFTGKKPVEAAPVTGADSACCGISGCTHNEAPSKVESVNAVPVVAETVKPAATAPAATPAPKKKAAPKKQQFAKKPAPAKKPAAKKPAPKKAV